LRLKLEAELNAATLHAETLSRAPHITPAETHPKLTPNPADAA